MSGQLPFRIVVVGHVDHGKSTLVGRILHETGALPEGKLEYLKDVCDKRGMPFEWAFLMDALQAERDQGITIDTSQIRFRTEARPYLIIDAPGHKEFLKNMITGAASAEAAVLVIDAHEGIQEQSRRHGYLLHLLGLRQITVVVNKMDLVEWSESRFAEVKAGIEEYLAGIGVVPTYVVPISARGGDNIASRSAASAWYTGPVLLEALDRFVPMPQPLELALRFPVQDVYKLDHRRIVAGRIESGRVKVGDRLIFAPSGKSARIATIESWSGDHQVVAAAQAGQSIGVTLDEPIFVERGNIAHLAEAAPLVSNRLQARVFWLGANPLKVGSKYKLKLATAEYQVEVAAIHRVIDVTDLANHDGKEVLKNAVAEIELRSRSAMAFESFLDNPRLGRFVLVDGYDIMGGGVIAEREAQDLTGAVSNDPTGTNIVAVGHKVSADARAAANGHTGGVVWLTGLSGSGKSSIAMELERRLFLKGWQITVLDGDNLRHGLCSDLGFSAEDRTENIRRAGEAAHLIAKAGMLVVCAFISPYHADRSRVRSIAPALFREIHVATPLEECEARDPKGLYGKARAGEIPEFTGVSAPYEAPTAAELVLRTSGRSISQSVDELEAYVEAQFGVSRPTAAVG